MPFIRESIGGMMVRRELQLSPAVAQNCFPEYGVRETEFQARPRTAMLPTRGHARFDAFGERVVGMTGTRELEERLAVVSGRTLRLYRDPADASSLTTLHCEGRPDGTEFTAWPVLGCYAHTDAELYYACADGRLRRRNAAGAVSVAIAPAGWSPLGVAGDRATGRIWLSAMEGPRIRCYTRQADGSLQRTESLDLDPVADSAVQQPEALAYLDGTLALLDAVAGDVYLFGLDGTEWEYLSQGGIRNTLSLQFAAGSSEHRRPVQPAGIRLSAATVHVIDRGTKRVREFSRGTGGERNSYAVHANVPGSVCGFVSGAASARVFVDARQAGGGRTFDPVTGIADVSGLTDEAPGPGTFRPSRIMPLDDSARWLGWECDRKFHLVDLRADRVLPNVAAAVDQITATSGRFVGVDRAEGWLKVSPAGAQLPLVGTEDARVKLLEPGAALRIPGWPRADSNPLRSAYVGPRWVLVNQDTFNLLRYDRHDLEAPPVQILADNVSYLAASGGTRTAGQCVLVLRGSRDTNVHVRWFDVIPTTAAETSAANATQVFSDFNITSDGSIDWNQIRSVACDDDYVWFLFDDSGTMRSSVVRRSNGAYVAGLSTIHDINTWGPPSNAGYSNAGIWGIDVSGGILRATLRSTDAGRATILRALRRNGESGYSALPEHYIDGQALYTESSALTHDALFLYDVAGLLQQDVELLDGTQTRAVTLSAFWRADPYRQSASRWRPRQWQQARAQAVAALRGRLYAFTATSLRLWESDPTLSETFPFTPVGVRDVGITAPDSLSVVEEVLFWIGASPGGGVRCWRIGADSDTAPDANLSQSVEEILDGIGVPIGTARGWTDDNGGHPTWVCGWRDPGLTLAYDTNAVEWHTRTSLRLAGDTGAPFPWQEAEQGHYRVEAAAQWRGRQFMGGYGAAGGLVVEPSVSDWRDVDGGAVQRVRAFHGLATERRRVRIPAVRVDTTYGVGDEAGTTPGSVNPVFTLQVSDDGGRTWGDPRERSIGGRHPAVFYRLGTSRFRAYRIVCEAPVGFTLLGVYAGDPRIGRRV